jgi:hypothetical protein
MYRREAVTLSRPSSARGASPSIAVIPYTPRTHIPRGEVAWKEGTPYTKLIEAIEQLQFIATPPRVRVNDHGYGYKARSWESAR